MKPLGFVHWMSAAPRHRHGLVVLQRAIGVLILFRVATEMPFASYLWGPNGIAGGSTAVTFGPGVGSILDRLFTTEFGTRLVLVTQALGGLGLLLQYRTRLATVVTWFAFFVLGQRLPELNDGGDNIATLALTYMAFTLPMDAKWKPGNLVVWMHNVGVLAIAAQVAVLYFVSGFMKMNGSTWHHGTALYVISQVEWFSHPATREMFKNPLIVTVATYSTMLFQVWFPLAILTSFRRAFVAVGILFHVGIAVTMGLVTFSTVMIGLELFLISDADYVRLRASLGGAATRVWPRSVTRAERYPEASPQP